MNHINYKEWARWYPEGSPVKPFGQSPAYEIGAAWLYGLDIEDWGCGYGWFKTLHTGGYWGIDGVHTGHENQIEDLANFKSVTPGIFMRGVMEHNENWRDILVNCATSATERIALVVTTPEGDGETVGTVGDIAKIPNIALQWHEITDILKAYGWTGKFDIISSNTHFYHEAIWLAERKV